MVLILMWLRIGHKSYLNHDDIDGYHETSGTSFATLELLVFSQRS